MAKGSSLPKTRKWYKFYCFISCRQLNQGFLYRGKTIENVIVDNESSRGKQFLFSKGKLLSCRQLNAWSVKPRRYVT